MKIHLAWIRFTAAAAIAAVCFDAHSAVGQYAPYGTTQYPAPQYSTTTPQGVQPYGVPQSQATPYQPAAPTAYQQMPVQQQPYNMRGTQLPQQAYQQPAFPQQAARPTYPSVAQQNGNGAPSGNMAPKGPTQSESLPAPEGSTNGNMQGNATVASPYPNTGYYGDASGSCGCNNNYSSCGGQDYGISNYFDGCGGGTVWFGGVYWLFMNRDDSSFQRLAVQIDDNSASYPYYPPASTTVLSTRNADSDFRNGAEIRFGSTFSWGGGGCDSGCDGGCGYGYGSGSGCGGCNSCQTCAAPNCGWEFAYWALDDDQNIFRTDSDLAPVDNFRYYSMKNFAGVEYDRDGAGATYAYRPVNVYYDYQVPVQDPNAAPPAPGDIRVVYQRIRSNFQCQNMELNFLKLPLYCGCTSAPSCGGCGGCDSGACGYGGACGGCDSGCGGCGGCDTCGPAFTLTGLCGIRYFKVDDDFAFNNTFQEYDGTVWGANDNINYQVNVDNRLLGWQIGANMNYCIACKWNLFCDSDFGIYGNDIDMRQRVYGAGNARFIGSGNNATVNSNKDDIAFLGELRVGGAYDVTCNWRLVAAYRVVALSGVALSTEQIPENFANQGEVGRINNDGSLFVHGIQVGAECRY